MQLNRWNSSNEPVGICLLACWLTMIGADYSKSAEMITQEQAIVIATEEFHKHGFTPSDYNVTIEPYNANPTEWMVWFDKKGPFPVPGGKHSILVDKSTGGAVFLRGE
jgi:hypothetical protein